MRRILGISAYYHDAAAALVANGRVVAAAQEERFTRLRHDPGFPANAARWCRVSSGLAVAQVLALEPANATGRQVLDDLGESDDPPFWR